MKVRENIKFQIEIKNRFQILKINKTNMEKYEPHNIVITIITEEVTENIWK